MAVAQNHRTVEAEITGWKNGDDPEEKLQFQAYLLDEETYAALMENLSEELFLPDTVEDDHFSGSIRLKEDATVFFSIPYDEGFRIRVDGERAEYKAYGGAFLALDLPAGEHSIEADYTPRGLGAGALLSLAGCILAVPGIGVPRLIESRKG